MSEKQELSETDNSSSGDIKLSFSLTKSDIFWYNLHFNYGLVILAIVFGVLLIPGLILALNGPKGDLGTFYIWIEIGIGLGLLISLSAIFAVVAQIYFFKGETVEKAMEMRQYIINSSGVAVFTANGHLARTWRDFKKVSRTRCGYYLRTTEKAAIILPLRVFKSPVDIQTFEMLIKSQKH